MKATEIPLTSNVETHEVTSVTPPSSCPSPMEMQQETDTDLTAETLVCLFEQKRGIAYDEKARPSQLASARILLDLKLPLTTEVVARVYDECCDDWWREHYGALHVSHLVERERNHGQPRIIRLLQRVQAKAQRKKHSPAQANNSSTTGSNFPPGMVVHIPDVLQSGTIIGADTPYGWTGWVWSGTLPEPVRLVQWNGAIVPLDDALKEGYNGGWERFHPHESDDLGALVRKYQAQGVLPQSASLLEGGNKNEPISAY